MQRETGPYSKNHPYLASIKERTSLSKPGSQKHTWHIVLDLKGSGYQYQVGDSIGIHSIHDPVLVQQTLEAMKASGNEIIADKQGATHTLKEFLTKKANITEISRKFVSELAQRQQNPEKKEHLQWLLSEGNKDALKSYTESHHLWDALAENEEAEFTHQEIALLLMPLLPRLYSIASSQKIVGDEVHLTVARTSYVTNNYQRFGVCTHYLCDFAPLYEPVLPVYIQPHHGFTLPEEPSVNMIMIGPGTGVAPFRAFMQERAGLSEKTKNWLFFGEWTREHEYFYQEFWEDLEKKTILHVDTAFSRDQEHKIYVQHRMLEKGEEFFDWIENGAIVYVCGDAHRMAKDVDATLHQIIQKHGNKSEQETKDYIKKLRADKRYLRDIY